MNNNCLINIGMLMHFVPEIKKCDKTEGKTSNKTQNYETFTLLAYNLTNYAFKANFLWG